MIIIGENSSEKDKLLGERISSLLKDKYNVMATTKISSEIKDEDLVNELQ